MSEKIPKTNLLELHRLLLKRGKAGQHRKAYGGGRMFRLDLPKGTAVCLRYTFTEQEPPR